MPNLDEFKLGDSQQWEQQVLKELGSDSLSQFMSQQLSEKITQPPYVDHDTAPKNKLIKAYRNCTHNPIDNWQGARYWLSMDHIVGSNAEEINKLSLQSLEGGADGITLDIEGTNRWEALIKGISLPDCHIGIRGPIETLSEFLTFLRSGQTAVNGFLDINDLDELINQPDQLSTLIGDDFKLRCLTIKETNAPIGSLEELCLLLSHAVMVINQLNNHGFSLVNILGHLQIRLHLSDKYLWEICRLRCLRILFHQVIIQYRHMEYPPAALPIHAVTSQPNGSDQSDNNQQLLSNTTQAMAAILGGCNILTIPPHMQDANGTRIARNISHILREESYLHRVSDPVAGSFYLEDLMHKMLKEVWSGFQEIEASGGYEQYINRHEA